MGERHGGVGVETVDGVVVVERSQVLEFAGAVPLVAPDHDGVLGGMLANGPENFVLDFVPNPGIGGGRLVQELHHHAGLVAVTLCHVGPDFRGVFAGIGADEERLFLVRTQVEIVPRALVQVQDDV